MILYLFFLFLVEGFYVTYLDYPYFCRIPFYRQINLSESAPLTHCSVWKIYISDRDGSCPYQGAVVSHYTNLTFEIILRKEKKIICDECKVHLTEFFGAIVFLLFFFLRQSLFSLLSIVKVIGMIKNFWQ